VFPHFQFHDAMVEPAGAQIPTEPVLTRSSRRNSPPAGAEASRGIRGSDCRRRSSRRSSQFCSALPSTSEIFSVRTISTAVSTRSLTIDSTSRRRSRPPCIWWLPPSGMGNWPGGEPARDLGLSTPVGPIMMMFFGATSSAISGSSRWRRILFRSAIATAFLAARCPMTYL